MIRQPARALRMIPLNENHIQDVYELIRSNPGEPPLSFWASLVSGPVIIASLTSGFTFFGTILLYRQLSQSEAGVLTLVLALVQLGLMIGGLGQPTLMQRVYSYVPEGEFDWRQDLLRTSMLGIPATCLLGLLALVFYDLDPGWVLLVVLPVVAQIVVLTESRLLNASRHYAWSSILMRLPNSLLILPALALVALDLKNQLEVTLKAYTAASLIIVFVGLLLLQHLLPCGRRIMSWKERRSGLVFIFTHSSYTLPEQGLLAFGGGMLVPSQLAVYGSMAPLLKPFDLLTDVLRNIFTTELIYLRQQRMRRIVASLRLAGIAAALLAIAMGPLMINWLYSGRYDQGNRLIPWLAAAGLFRLLEVFPRSHIIGQGSQELLRRFVLWQIVSSALLLAFGLALVMHSGVVAIAITMAAIQVARYLISDLFFHAEQQESRD